MRLKRDKRKAGQEKKEGRVVKVMVERAILDQLI
jgi:hypothetical protein